MNVDAAIVEVFKSKLFNDMCRRYGKDNHEDLKSEVILIICEMPEEKRKNIVESGYLLPYALQAARFQGIGDKYNSFQKYFSNKNEVPYEIKTQDGYEASFMDTNRTQTLLFEEYDMEMDLKQETIMNRIISDSLNQRNEYFYHSRLLMETLKYRNIKKTAQAIGIPYNSVRDNLKSYKQVLIEWAKG